MFQPDSKSLDKGRTLLLKGSGHSRDGLCVCARWTVLNTSAMLVFLRIQAVEPLDLPRLYQADIICIQARLNLQSCV